MSGPLVRRITIAVVVVVLAAAGVVVAQHIPRTISIFLIAAFIAFGAAPLVKRLVDAEDRVDAARKAKEAAEKTLGDRRDAVRLALASLAPPREK